MNTDHVFPISQGFDDVEAARRLLCALRAANMRRLVSLKIESEPQIVREFVEACHEKLLALVYAGLPLSSDTIKYALEQVSVFYAGGRDVAQREIAQGSDLSLKIFKTLYGVDGHLSSPSGPFIRMRPQPTAPSKRHRPLNMPPGTLDKVRAALDRDVSVADVYLAAFTAAGILGWLIVLMAIGAGR